MAFQTSNDTHVEGLQCGGGVGRQKEEFDVAQLKVIWVCAAVVEDQGDINGQI